MGTTLTGGDAAPAWGTIFSMDATGGLTTLHTFTGRGGASPEAGLIQASDGIIYGTTDGGGAFGSGTVFSIDPDGTVTTLHDFGSATDGADPASGLIQANDGTFYGTTPAGPIGTGGGLGTVFNIDSAGRLTTLHAFTSYGDGAEPRAGLIQARDGSFYGTTSQGGTGGGYGTVFKIDTQGTFSILHSFTGIDGAYPIAELVQAIDGTFYGTTYGPGFGTVFRIDAAGTLTLVHAFKGGSEGAYPYARLIQGADGAFYGTTRGGGVDVVDPAERNGTVFRVDTAGTLTVLHAFAGGPDGLYPYASLIQANDGSLYGTTGAGGQFGDGTVFKLDQYGILTTLHSFSGTDGIQPLAALIQAQDGSFWGTASSGGPNGGGIVFRLTEAHGDATPPRTIPGRVEAEDYDRGGPGVGYVDSTFGNEGHAYRSDDVDIKTSAEGGFAVGWFTAGEWLAYTVNVQSDGIYTLQARVGSALPGRTFHVEIDGRDVTGPISVPQKSDWDQYDTVTGPTVRLHAGVQLLRVVMGPLDYMDLQWIALAKTPQGGPFTGTPWPAPGRIEAENYDLGGQGVGYADSTTANEQGFAVYRDDDVDIKASAEGGYAVGWITAGEWLAYTLDVQIAGTYTIQARVGSALPDRTFHLEADGSDVTGSVAVPQLSDWDQYATVTMGSVTLSAGRHILHVVMGPQDWMDFQWLEIRP